MKPYRVTAYVVGALALTYAVSYFALFRNGHYEAAVYGLAQHPDGYVIAAPKSAFGYQWNPFGTDTYGSEPKPKWIMKAATGYAPMIWIDRLVFHRSKTVEEAGSGKFRVVRYFDISTCEFRNIEPK